MVGVPAAASAAPARLTVGPAATVATPPEQPNQPGAATVTLITGDRITVDATGGLSVRRGQDRSGIRFLVQRDRGNVTVLPSDALPLVRSGKVDRRLFDVTGLIEAGLDDAHRGDLPLLVGYRSQAGQRRGGVDLGGARVTRDLPVIGGAAVSARKDRAQAVWTAVTTGSVAARTDTAGGVGRIWLDGRRQLTLEHSVPQIGAPAAHRAGWTGRGVTVAVLDTGVDVEHPDLVGRVADSRNFTEVSEPGDEVGHGTHVASTIAGSGAASDGRNRGVAPDATLISGKVCETNSCTESAILAGMQWAAQEKRATVVNLSLGGWDTPEIDPLEEAVETLTASTGTLFVIAAGNDGSDGSVGSPGSADSALTVGAVDRDDDLADFSSRGPRVGDDALKPDVTAPGVDIVAARASGTTMGEVVGEGYVSASGTSMATPHVAGTVALLAQRHPDWQAGQLKAAVTASAEPNPELTAYQQGAGRVDAARAVDQLLTSEPGGVSFGRTQWPHDDDEPIVKTVTWRNGGTTPLTLDLTLTATDPDGEPAPAGVFTLGAQQVTVPAGGEASASVTVDTSVDGPDGYYTGRIVATSGEVRAVTPIAVHREVESYPVTFRYLDSTGAAAAEAVAYLVGLDNWSLTEAGEGVYRLPKGRYGLVAYVLEREGEEVERISALAWPEVTVTKPTTVTADARSARPVHTSVPEPSAVPALIDLSAEFAVDEDGGYGFSLWADEFAGLYSAQVGRRGSAEQFVGSVSSQWIKPGVPSTPYLYAVAEALPGRFPTGYVKDFRRQDLAKAVHQFRGPTPGLEFERTVFPRFPKHDTGSSAAVLPTAVPGQRVEWHNTKNVHWQSSLYSGKRTEEDWLDFYTALDADPKAYRAGKTYRDTWNVAPYGPSVNARWPIVGRFGDTILVSAPLYDDQAGHYGASISDRGRTALYRDGELVGETDYTGFGEFEVPPGGAKYRVEVTAERSFTDLASRIEATWTFRSRHVPDTDFVPVPAMAVRFTPELRPDNSAPAGQRFLIPFDIQRQGSTAEVKAVTVEVSYDEGQTWRRSQVQQVGDRWVAAARHPAGKGHASLRATVRDAAGNTLTQETIGAYRLR
ncbi:S8 family serine peptidase [Micromonospora sp. NPDC000207]|uniref:S8 family serine peptidase n=1 Tax=Micromonospora sp. NPDC000207 TaxID=3154246 RepID=UPI00332EBA0D